MPLYIHVNKQRDWKGGNTPFLTSSANKLAFDGPLVLSSIPRRLSKVAADEDRVDEPGSDLDSGEGNEDEKDDEEPSESRTGRDARLRADA